MNYRLAKDRLECRVTLLVVWHCVSHLVASFVAQWSCMAERNFGQTSVSLRLNRTSATCACCGFVRCLKSSCLNVGVVLVGISMVLVCASHIGLDSFWELNLSI